MKDDKVVSIEDIGNLITLLDGKFTHVACYMGDEDFTHVYNLLKLVEKKFDDITTQVEEN